MYAVCDNNNFDAIEFNDFIECNFIANKNECERFLMSIIKTPNFNYEKHKKIRKRLRIFVVFSNPHGTIHMGIFRFVFRIQKTTSFGTEKVK